MTGPFLSEGYAEPLFAALPPSFTDLRLIYSRRQVLMVVVFSSRVRSFLYRKSLVLSDGARCLSITSGAS
jgi:hypothetical protein